MAWVNLNKLYVPTSRTINGKALSSNVTLGASDIKLSNDTTLQSAWDSISQSLSSDRLWYGTFVFNGSGWNTAISRNAIASHFGVSLSEVASKIAPIVYNGDLDANSCMVVGNIYDEGLVIRGNTSSTYRANVYLIML